MRLAVIQDFLRAGGTEMQSLLLVRSWIEAGEEAGLITFRPGGLLHPRAQALNIPVHALQFVDLKLSFCAPFFIRKLKKEDVEGVVLMGRNANRLGALLKKRIPLLKVVATCRTGRRIPRGYMQSLFAADWVVTNSQWGAKQMREAGIPSPRLKVIPNARTLDWNHEEAGVLRKRIRSRFGIRDNTVVMIQIAAFVPGKNHGDLLEIMAGIDDEKYSWELWLVGTGPHCNSVKQWARQLKIDERIRFLGFLEEVKPFLAASDIFVSTSLEESLPNTMIEAQIAGLPIIAYDTAGVRETFKPDESGVLVQSKKVEEFLNKLVPLMADPELRSALGKNARNFSRSFPDISDHGKRYRELFD